jgi:hypothetical protein
LPGRKVLPLLKTRFGVLQQEPQVPTFHLKEDVYQSNLNVRETGFLDAGKVKISKQLPEKPGFLPSVCLTISF